MEPKLSDRLQAMVKGQAAGSAPVKVRLRAGLTAQAIKGAVRKLKTHLGGAEYLNISGTVHGRLPLVSVGQVTDLPEVEWVDVERAVPVEELIDPC